PAKTPSPQRIDRAIVAGHFQISYAMDWRCAFVPVERNRALPVRRNELGGLSEILRGQQGRAFQLYAEFGDRDFPACGIDGTRFAARPILAGGFEREIIFSQM